MKLLKILLVEDSPTDAELTLRELKRGGVVCDIKHVDTEHDYRHQLSHFQPDIILSDYSLPTFDGLRALEIVKAEQPDIPFIFVSGTMGEETAIESLKQGAMDYIIKGNLSRLPTAINNALDRVQKREALKQAEEALLLHNHAIEVSATPTLIVDVSASGMPIIYINHAFEHVTGYSKEEVIGRNWNFLQGDDTNQLELEKLRQAIEEGSASSAVLRNYRKDGSLFINELYLSPVLTNPNGKVQYYVGVQNDITQIRQYQEALERQANYDLLTGLANRNLLKERIKHAFNEGRRSGKVFTVAFIDIDNFKRVNDSLGHSIGDELIKMVAERLQHCVREGDTVARVGGDEFVMLLTSQSSEESTHVVLQRINIEMGKPFPLTKKQLTVTCSIGLASFPRDGDNAETLMANADSAMYRAKANGRNNFQFYAKEMNAELGERLSLENDLWHALERDELILHYQPQINMFTGEVIGMEALVRWQHPTRGLIPPIQFISIAEDDGLIIPIGEWVLRKACEDNQQLQLDGFKPIRVAVNLSARQLVQKSLVRTVSQILAQTRMQPQYLELEITESMIMHNVEDSISLLSKINKLGVQLSLDDFGTGYSSLAYLKRFPIKRLKIDKSFIRDIATDPNDAIISRSIIALAHALQVESIAEGVETVEQFEFLKANGCNEVQGYLFSKPLPIDALRIFLASNPVRTTIPSAALDF
ncbi:EAL domain-containing response regulator [Methyloradius palustris]|uniref:GGDEF domain-containing protein n=1 Tax=Methyloradius palustris TaxID=2778876 RepID=A0A8D5JYH6_9PROT|nr:GGDEF domain-containing response regulator [Methyloradius palustris]BCM24702.1 GGDEF domain-containing protein [Methyloradius palustris]